MAQENTAVQDAGASPMEADLRNIPIDLIDPDPRQPRTDFDEEALNALAENIEAVGGLLQTVVVRPSPTDPGRFMLIGGERRYRASKKAGSSTLPCIVRQGDRIPFVMSMVENMLRASLNPIEEARAFRRCHDEYGMSYHEIDRTFKFKRKKSENVVRLLELPEEIQQMVENGTLPPSYALGLHQYAETRDVVAMAYALADGRDPGVVLPKRKTKYVKGEPKPTEFREYFLLAKQSDRVRRLADALLAHDTGIQRRAWMKNSRTSRTNLQLNLRAMAIAFGQMTARLEDLEKPSTVTFSPASEAKSSPLTRPTTPPKKPTQEKWLPLPDESTFEKIAGVIRLVSFDRRGGRLAYLSEERLKRKGCSPELLLEALRVFRDQWNREPATGNTQVEREFLGFLKGTRENSGCNQFFSFIGKLRDLDTSEDPVPLSPLSDD